MSVVKDDLYDEDGIDGPWERRMAAPEPTVKPGQRFRDVRVDEEGRERVLEVRYVYPDKGRGEDRVRCTVLKDTRLDVDSRRDTTVALKRLLSPVYFYEVFR